VDAPADERPAFEAWGNNFFNYGFYPGSFLIAEYEHEETQMAWEGWQARAIIAATRPAAPVQPETDLLDIVRTFVCIADRMAELTDAQREHYPSPAAEGSPLMYAARQACVERGFTAGGLSVDGAESALPTQAAPEAWQPIKTAPRDGRNILVRFDQDGVSQAKYIPGLPRPWQFIDTNNGISWMVNAAADGAGGPSCWMPMPGDASPRGAA
jgi:hypothetical protein